MATLYKGGGAAGVEVSPANGKSFTYEELRGFIGGNIQIVPMPSGKDMVVHDEGKLIGLHPNYAATDVWKKEYPIAVYPDNNDELVVGPALVATLAELGDEDEEQHD